MSFLKRNKQITSEIVEHKPEGAFSDSIPGDVQRWRFNLLNFLISQQLPRLSSLYFFSFPKWPLKLNWVFHWQQSGHFEQLTNSEASKKCSFVSNNLKSTLDAPLTLSIYPLMFVASIESPDSTIMTGKNTYCTTF